MDAKKVSAFLLENKDKLPEDKIPFIKERLTEMDDSKGSALMLVELKMPSTALIISLLVGGGGFDRFYLGQTGLGIIKLITIGGLGLWYFADWFLIMKATKDRNYEALKFVLV